MDQDKRTETAAEDAPAAGNEIAELRKQIAELQVETEILRKATAHLSKEMNH